MSDSEQCPACGHPTGHSLGCPDPESAPRGRAFDDQYCPHCHKLHNPGVDCRVLGMQYVQDMMARGLKMYTSMPRELYPYPFPALYLQGGRVELSVPLVLPSPVDHIQISFDNKELEP